MFIQLGCKKTIYAVIITESGIQSGRRILNENSMDSFCIVDMLISSRDGSNVCFSSAVFAGSRRFLLSRHLFNTASKVETSVDRILHHIQDFKRHLMKSYGKVYRPICRWVRCYRWKVPYCPNKFSSHHVLQRFFTEACMDFGNFVRTFGRRLAQWTLLLVSPRVALSAIWWQQCFENEVRKVVTCKWFEEIHVGRQCWSMWWSLCIDINPCFIIRTLKLTAPEKYSQKAILFLLWCGNPGSFVVRLEKNVCRVVALAFGFRQPWQYFKKRSWPMDSGRKVAKFA